MNFWILLALLALLFFCGIQPWKGAQEMTNLEIYNYTELSLAPQQREVLSNCFLGALSVVVSPEVWRGALRNAVQAVMTIRPEESGVRRA